MPKLELKVVQKELEQGMIWPLYWIYGPEVLKSRELLKRIRKVVLGEEAEGKGSSSLLSLSEEVLDSAEVDGSEVLERAQSLALGGGVKFIVIRDAQSLKHIEQLSALLGPPQKKEALSSVCVCLAQDLDARKKFSKLLLDQAAVVPCEEVVEAQRESWIHYLAKRRGIGFSPRSMMSLLTLEPWSLDIVEQELEKWSVAGSAELIDGMLSGQTRVQNETEGFLDRFFCRDLKGALTYVSYFADHVEESLPLLGLLGWNVRQLALLIADREKGTRHAKVNPYLAERFRKWSSYWKLEEVIRLQAELTELDFSLKQTPLLPLGLWSSLTLGYGK